MIDEAISRAGTRPFLGVYIPEFKAGTKIGFRHERFYARDLGTARRFTTCLRVHRVSSLSRLLVGKKDKLGHIVLDILWCGPDYAVYRSERGVYVHFSDCPKRALEQRKAFTKIAPELCELRVFTSRMGSYQLSPTRGRVWSWFRISESELYDHNIAQALMLTMEGQFLDAKAITKAALNMAVRRITNDNTIRYACTCLFFASCWIAAFLSFLRYADAPLGIRPYLIASIFGAIGAVFSIITRIEAFEMKPCQQSSMNYLMSGIRVVIGIIGGVVLLLFFKNAIGASMPRADNNESVAAFGFVGGFSERLLKGLIRQTATSIAPTPGTPVQEARRLEEAREGRRLQEAQEARRFEEAQDT